MTLQGDARALVVEQLADLGQTFTEEVLDAVFLDTSEVELLAVADTRVRWEWWDGQKPINGVPADQVRQRFTIPGRAYLVYVDDQLVYFQPHVPQTSGVESLDPASDGVVTAFVASLVHGLARDALALEATTALRQLAEQQQARESAAAAAEAAELQLPSPDLVVPFGPSGRRRSSAAKG